jgi:hypothetical protein
MTSTPRYLQDAIRVLDCDSFQLGTVRDYRVASLEQGELAHLGIRAAQSIIDAPESVLPPSERGRFSAWNIDGREVVRKDLPKRPRSFVVWIYPYGDTTRSKVPAYQTRDAYARQRLHGHGDRLLISVNAPADSGLVRVGFRVDRVFAKPGYDDDPELALAAGLLRENVAPPGAVCSDMSPAEWTAYRDVGWELLPPGLRGDALAREVTRRLGMRPDDERTRVAEQRLAAMMSLHPVDVYTGAGRFDRYIAFVIRDDLVVLENLSYGNAVYVMYENWQDLSRRSRLELLANPAADYTRIVHAGDWISELRETVAMSRRRR